MKLLANKTFLRATATLVGTMVGVGVFGIPFAFSKSGLWVGLLFFVGTGLVTYLMNILYGEVILRTTVKHQLVGYAGLYEGAWARRAIFFTVVLSTYGALLAYIIASGEFLHTVFGPWFSVPAHTYSVWFFVAASLLVALGIKTLSWFEVGLAGLFMSVIVLILGVGIGDIDVANYQYTNWEYWFFPYGIFLFAFSGMAAIPMQRRILGDQAVLLKSSIRYAMLFVACAYLLFGLTVFGISGDVTSPEAIGGLVGFVGERIIFLGSLFGALAVSTSFLMLGSSLVEVFRLDYHMHRLWSWALVVMPPAVLYWGGMRNFIDVIGMVGSVAIGLESAVLIWMYVTVQKKGDRTPEYHVRVPSWSLYVLALIFVGAAVYEFFV